MTTPDRTVKSPKRLLTVALIALTAIAVPAVVSAPKLLIWNASASVPIGLYAILPNAHVGVGDLAVSSLPADIKTLAATRHYLPDDVLLIKPVKATENTTVCRSGTKISVANVPVGDAKPFDASHRSMPVWSGCRRLTRDEIFLMNPAVADSFDGRYFGPTPVSLIRGRAYPLLTFGKPDA